MGRANLSHPAPRVKRSSQNLQLVAHDGAAEDVRMKRRALAIAAACAPWAAARALTAPDEDAARAWATLVREAATRPMPERIVFANIAVNRRIAYVEDGVFGTGDAWQTPVETLARGRGDCEDIAIAKFFLLLDAAVEPTRVRLLYARHRDLAVPGVETPHVVAIAWHAGDDPFVLDNLNLIVLPLSQRDDLRPLFSFDRTHLWLGLDGPARGSSAERLPPWRRLLERMARQRH